MSGEALVEEGVQEERCQEEQVRAAIRELLPNAALQDVTVADFRRSLSEHLGLGNNGLEDMALSVTEWVREAVHGQADAARTLQNHMEGIIEGLGVEAPTAKRQVYLVTISHVLPGHVRTADLRDLATLSRQEIGEAVRLAFDQPLRGTKPRADDEPVVTKLVVYQEGHQDGSKHFHVAVRLTKSLTWGLAKRTLRTRDHVAAHFSSTHTQFWSAVRYGYMPTLAKPEVDAEPLSWSCNGGWGSLDLFAESQRPWNADIWMRRSEAAEKAASASSSQKARCKFNKLDLTSIILAKGLTTVAALLEYTQNHGTEAMQLFVHQRQKFLKEYLAEAQEWGGAQQQAAADRQTDWALVCQTATKACPHGESCPYATAAAMFFEANSATLSLADLAAALRNIIVAGPSKTTRAPMIVGPTNSGKSTLVLPFDDVFGFTNVFHKPALNSSFALRNILKQKRFLFWDDYQPVVFGQKTVPVSTFLSLFQGQPFEVQVSQSFNDGNIDFEWHHGCVLTAKAESLWTPMPGVDAEDVRHMQSSRLLLFQSTAQVKHLKYTAPCARCMCSWIVDGAGQFDAKQALVPPPPTHTETAPSDHAEQLPGMADLSARAKLPPGKAKALMEEILALGAVCLDELDVRDWQSLTSWAGLLPFEQRRLLSALKASTTA